MLKDDIHIRITEAVIIALVGKLSLVFDDEALRALFKRSEGVEVTEAMLMAAASPRTMGVLLDHSPSIRITPAVLEAAATKRTGLDLLTLLLAHDPDVHITEAVVVGALEQRSDFIPRKNEDIIYRLLDRQG